MVSRRNFFAIFLMMFVVLFLCQFSQVMRENLNQSNNDSYDMIDLPEAGEVWSGVKSSELYAIPEDADYGTGTGRNVIFIGKLSGDVGKTVDQWCGYIKAPLTEMQILPLYSTLENRDNVMILIDGASVDPRCYMETIRSYVKHGATVVFCTLPGSYIIRSNEALRNLLGITEVVRDSIVVDGIRVFDGAFIGGEAVYKVIYEEDAKYQDLDLEMPWYITAEGSKTYIIGMLDEDRYEREKFPRIAWRYTGGNIKVFAINGDYMKTQVGLGLLDMCLYESADYALYPVVNAQTSLFLDVPDFADENSEAMNSVYSRNMSAAQRDVFLPGIISVVESNKLVPSFMMTMGYDLALNSSTDTEDIRFYLEQINGMSGEAGRSYRYVNGDGLLDKILHDNKLYPENSGGYHFRTAYVDSIGELLSLEAGETDPLQGIVTFAGDEDTNELFGFIDDDVTFQNITQNAFEYSYSRDLLARSLNTSIGYSALKVDMHNIMWPEGNDDHWEVYFDRIFSNISTFWSRYNLYEQTTLSESDLRIRRLLSLDYDSFQKDGDNDRTITLRVAGGGSDCWFLLRTHEQQISGINGAEYEKIEDDAYLIHVHNDTVTINLEDSIGVLDYDSPFRELNLLGNE